MSMKKSMYKFLSLMVCLTLIAVGCEPQEKTPEYPTQEESSVAVAEVANQILSYIDPQNQQDLVNSVMSLMRYGLPEELSNLLKIETRSAKSTPISMISSVCQSFMITNISDLYAEYTLNMDSREWDILPSKEKLKFTYPVFPDTADLTNYKMVVLTISGSESSGIYPSFDKAEEDTLLFNMPKNLSISMTYDTKTILSATMLLDFGSETSTQTLDLSLDLSGRILDVEGTLRSNGADALVQLTIDKEEVLKLNLGVIGDFSGDFEFTEEEILPKIASVSAKLALFGDQLVADASCAEATKLLTEFSILQQSHYRGTLDSIAFLTGEANIFNTYVKSNLAVKGNDFAKIQLNYISGNAVTAGMFFYKDNSFVSFEDYIKNEEIASVIVAFAKLGVDYKALLPFN